MNFPQYFVVTIVFGLFCLKLCSAQAVRRSTWSEFCNETVKCDKSAWLTCKSSSCVCLLEDMVFSSSESKCLSKPGERCRFQIMDAGGENKDVALYGNTECVPNSNCANGFTCTCDWGFYETVNGSCEEQKDFNATCEDQVECKGSKFLKCLNGLCACATDLNQIYDLPNNSTLRMCVVSAGKPIKGPGICVSGSIFQNGLCACVPEAGFYAGPDGRCQPRLDFGHPCTEDSNCQFDGKYLTCVDGKCGCNPDKFTFQREEKTSEVEEERDVFGHQNHRPDDDDNNFYSYNPNQYIDPVRIRGKWLRGDRYGHGTIAVKVNKTIQESQCVGLATKECNPDSNCVRESVCKSATSLDVTTAAICICTPESELYAGNGTCHRKKGVNEPCSGDEECLFAEHFLTCVNGTCGCDPAKYFYVHLRKGDLLNLDEQMDVKGYHYDRSPPPHPIYGAGYFTRNDTVVYGVYLRLERYTSTIRATHLELTEDLEQCVGLAGRGCNPDFKCVQNSACQKSLEFGFGSCKCSSGYSQTSNSLCGIGHGENCSHSTPCSDSFLCTNGTCDCPMVNHQIYSLDAQKCLALALSPCSSDSDCVPNSVCVLNEATSGKECRCSIGYTENARGSCERAWGSGCKYNDEIPCDSVAGLRCRNEICSCKDTWMYFNETARECRGLVGSRCQLSYSYPRKICVTGAECVMTNLILGGQCRCSETFVVNSEKLCVRTEATTGSPINSDTSVFKPVARYEDDD